MQETRKRMTLKTRSPWLKRRRQPRRPVNFRTQSEMLSFTIWASAQPSRSCTGCLRTMITSLHFQASVSSHNFQLPLRFPWISSPTSTQYVRILVHPESTRPYRAHRLSCFTESNTYPLRNQYLPVQLSSALPGFWKSLIKARRPR